MNCPEFLEYFSDYVDGACEAALRENVETHLTSCGTCRCYWQAYRRGRELLRSFPEVEISQDFHPRLQHRLFHLEDEEALARSASGSATTAVTVIGMALFLTIAAWSPLMRSQEPEVELSPIVVSRPAKPPLGLRAPPVSLAGTQAARLPLGMDIDRRDLWEGSHLLLYQHSPLSEKYRRTSVRRAGLD